MDCGWRGFRFDLPTGLDDETVLTFVSRKGGAVDLNVTFTRDAVKGKLEAYLADAVEQMKTQLSGYRLVDKTEKKIAGKDGFVLEHTTTSKDGATLRMLQAYVPDGDDVVIITGTSADADRARLQKHFDGIVSSLKRPQQPGSAA
jgi:hypothetical protein